VTVPTAEAPAASDEWELEELPQEAPSAAPPEVPGGAPAAEASGAWELEEVTPQPEKGRSRDGPPAAGGGEWEEL
jgi:hypothetical protein